MLIRVHVSLSCNAVPYYEYMRENYRKLCSSSTSLEFFVYTMEGQLPVKCEKQIECLRSCGSVGHANTIEAILREPVSEDIKLIADSDTVMLAKNWDQYLKYSFEMPGQYGIVGSTYECIGGFSTESIKRQAYKCKPTLTWAALSPKYDFSRLNPQPAKQSNLLVDTFEKSMMWNLPIGFELFRDVGWQVPQYLHDNKIPYIYMENFRPTQSQSRAVKSGNDYNEEFQLWGTPLVGHQRGSNKRKFRASPESTPFYDAIENYIYMNDL